MVLRSVTGHQIANHGIATLGVNRENRRTIRGLETSWKRVNHKVSLWGVKILPKVKVSRNRAALSRRKNEMSGQLRASSTPRGRWVLISPRWVPSRYFSRTKLNISLPYTCLYLNSCYPFPFISLRVHVTLGRDKARREGVSRIVGRKISLDKKGPPLLIIMYV